MESNVQKVNIDLIIPNRFQPRLNFEEKALQELASSIKEHGIIQPIVVRRLGDKYEIIAGERRYKAATMVGLTEVPVIISNLDDKQSALVAVAENVQRKNLSSIEEALSYKKLIDKNKITQDELAKRMGVSQSAVANKLRLLNLSKKVQNALLTEKISERHARSLLQLPTHEKQDEVLDEVIAKRMTVKQLDEYIKNLGETESTEIKEIKPIMPANEEVAVNDNNLIYSANPLNAEEKSNDNNNLETFNIFDNALNGITTNIFDEPINSEENKLEEPLTTNDDLPKTDTLDLLEPKMESLANVLDNDLKGTPLNAEEKIDSLDIKAVQDREIAENNSSEENMAENNDNKPLTESDNSFSKLFNIFKSPTENVSLEDEQTNMNTELGDTFNPFTNLESSTTEDIEREIQEAAENARKQAIAEMKSKEERIISGDLQSVKKAYLTLKDEIQKAGFNIETEDFDFEDMYQLIIKIKKQGE
jgi:ParB family transcriptional regulator, chromosome partitioning protein